MINQFAKLRHYFYMPAPDVQKFINTLLIQSRQLLPRQSRGRGSFCSELSEESVGGENNMLPIVRLCARM